MVFEFWGVIDLYIYWVKICDPMIWSRKLWIFDKSKSLLINGFVSEEINKYTNPDNASRPLEIYGHNGLYMDIIDDRDSWGRVAQLVRALC